MLTYQEQLDLVQRKLATVKVNGNLSTFKYARKVMFDYLWDSHPELLECRGHTYDNTTGELVVAAPRKSFNYLENDWWAKVPLETPVRMYKKINGYMACASLHNGQLIVSTTGTTTSEYAVWAREYIERKYYKASFAKGCTYLYEIVHPNDPHIVREQEGLHFLGVRNNDNSWFRPASIQEVQAYPKWTLKTAIEYAQTDRGEGFMLYTQDEEGNFSNACKLKTPYYVGKKILMRLSKANTASLWKGNCPSRLPEMWYDVAVALPKHFDEEAWNMLPEQNRRLWLEEMQGE